MLSTQFLRRSVSVDFTVPSGIANALAVAGTGQSIVPLATLAKRPLRNFDLRDEAGAAVPVLGRDHNGPLAHDALLAATSRALGLAGLGKPSPNLAAQLHAVATGNPHLAQECVAELLSAAEEGDAERRALLEDDAALFLLADLADNYILAALCESIDKRRVLKLSFEEPLTTAKPSLLERLGWRPLVIELDAPGASRTASYHAEIVVPDELRFDTCFLYDTDSGEVHAADNEADRAAVHAASVPPGTRTALLFDLRAERVGSPVVGAIVAWTTSLLLVAGVLVGDFDPTQADPAVSVLLAASAVFAGAVARSGEHRFVQALFAGPRLLLLVSALSALAAAAALAYGLPSSAVDTIWIVAAALSLAVAVALTITLVVARPIVPGRHDDT